MQLIHGDRDRAGRGISVTLQVLEHRVAMEAEHVARRVDDPDIGLVGDEPADVADLALGMGQHGQGRIGQDPDGPLEDGAAVHGEVMQPLLEGIGRRWDAAPAGRPAQQVASRTVRAELIGDQSLVGLSGRQQDGAGAVAEQRETLLIMGVDDATVAVAADDQRTATISRADELRRDDQREDEARTGGLDVERRDTPA